MTTAYSLIARSISHTEIASADYTEELASELLAASEDSVDAGNRVEYWGTDDDGSEWRVHLSRSASEVAS